MTKPHVAFTGRINGSVLCRCGQPMHDSGGKFMCHNRLCEFFGKFYMAIMERAVLFYKDSGKK